MINKDNAPVLLGMAAIVVTLGIGTCSTNVRIDDGFTSMNLRIDDTNRRMDDGFNNLQRQIDDTNRRMDDGFNNVNRRIDDTNQRIDDIQEDVRELRTMLFETLKDAPPAN